MLTVDRVPINSLTTFPGNPRRGAVPAIAASIQKNGVYKPIVVQKSTRLILAGNHTWQAAQEVGHTEIDVVWADVDDAAARRIVLTDNRTSDLGSQNLTDLAELLQSLDDVEGTGYDDDYLEGLLAALHDDPQFPDDDDLLDDVEDASQPTLSIKMPMETLTRFRQVPGDDDLTRLLLLLDGYDA